MNRAADPIVEKPAIDAVLTHGLNGRNNNAMRGDLSREPCRAARRPGHLMSDIGVTGKQLSVDRLIPVILSAGCQKLQPVGRATGMPLAVGGRPTVATSLDSSTPNRHRPPHM